MPVPSPQLPPTFYQSPPGSGSNDGAVPTASDFRWPIYSNLTPAQKAAFAAFPQDLVRYAKQRRWQAEISALPITVNVRGQPTVLLIDMSDRGQARIDKLSRNWGTGNATAVTNFLDATGTVFQINPAAIQAINTAVTNMVEQSFTVLNSLLAGINAVPPTITTRAQIDAAIAPLSPNSPSATNPSPT